MTKKNKIKQKIIQNKKEKIKNSGNNFSLRPSLKIGLKPETKYGIWAIFCFLFSLFFILAAFGKAGIAGRFFYDNFSILFGVGYLIVPILFILLGASFTQSVRPNISTPHILSSLLFLFSSLGIIDIVITNLKGIVPPAEAGGIVGSLVSYPLIKLFDIYTAILFLGALLIISLLVMFDARPNFTLFFIKLWSKIKSLFKRKEEEENYPEEDEENQITANLPLATKEEKIENKETKKEQPKIEKKETEDFSIKAKKNEGAYIPPPLSLLEVDKGKPNVGDVKANLNIIKRTLQNFGIEVEMDEVTIGPTVTRYALKPAEGMKLSRILALQNDLSLALAAHPLRVEAPIPGKSLVGIEVPNKTKSTVGLATLLGDEKFQNEEKPLVVALGKNIAGKAFFGNLAKMPHLLIAGATGSGKSVTIHAIITSLLYRNGPEEMQFIMIDPKRVELTLYNKIPHLLTPVITDPKKTILALKWATKEMERRYEVLEKESVRDISSYHNKVKAEKIKNKKEEDENFKEKMPYIIIIIDELADIMTAYPRELEASIVRLAQMSRAVGIHLILSTQRPSVNIITGLIKANVPARVALQVSSQIDSRTILDEGGAEKLLGAGDMLYSSGEMSKPERLQSAFIGEDEVKKVTKFLADSYRNELPIDINLGDTLGQDKNIFSKTLDFDKIAANEESDGDDDELYEEARQIVIENKKASTSYLQRRLKLGYSRAARLMDVLENRGVIGPSDGAKPREILIDNGNEVEKLEEEMEM